MSAKPVPVAVVGMACRFPGADDVAAYWDLLVEGRDAVHRIADTRWNLDALRRFHDGRPLPKSATDGGWLDDVRGLDAPFFRLSPREARTMDPKQRLALEVAHEALEDGQIAPEVVRARGQSLGVFLGTAQSEYLMRFYHRGEVTGAKADRYSGPGNDASFSSGRISQVLGLEGPSVNVNTACSTSLVAVHEAMRAIAFGDCELALAGGVSIIESPEHSLVMSSFGVLSPDARCKAFDAAANGYVRAEGCGFVLLKRLDLALADGDRIHAVLEGSAVNHNGQSDNLMAPSADAQARLLRRALEVAGVGPGDVDVVEAHGTGTPVGDPLEIQALAEVFAAEHASRPMPVASVKTNIGHLEVSAGIAGLVKAVLEVREGQVPAHLHLHDLNPAIDASLPFVYPKALQPWPTTDGPRRAVVNSFGISGINAAVVVAQAPQVAAAPSAGWRTAHTLVVSGQDDTPVRALAGATADLLAAGASWPSVAAATLVGRDLHPRQLWVTTDSAAVAEAALRATATGEAHEAARWTDAASTTPTVAWLFTGQGAQQRGMGEALAAWPAFADALAAADAALAPHLGGASIRAVMRGEAHDLDDTTWTQPALFALEVALAAAWSSLGVVPDVLAGHSIGEIAAAHVAGVLSLDDAAALVAARGRLMGALPRDGAMAMIFAPADEVRAALSDVEGVEIGADNGPRATVVSGRTEGVDALVAAFDARDVGTRRLTVSHAFHSPLMDPMLDDFRMVLEGLTFHPARIPILSTVTGARVDDAIGTVAYWLDHARGTVRFREAIEALAAEGVGLFLELGPGGTLVGMGRRCVRRHAATWLATLDAERGEVAFMETVGALVASGVSLDRWALAGADRATPPPALPPYPWQRRPHWIDDPGPPTGEAAAAAPAVVGQGVASWRIDPRPVDVVPGPPVAPGTIVVEVADHGPGAALAAALVHAGHRVVRVAAADSSTPADAQLDPADADAVRAFVAAQPDLRAWVATWATVTTAVDPDHGAVPHGPAPTSDLAALHVAQAVLGACPDARLWTVTEGALAVRPGERPALAQVGVWGIARVVALEHRQRRDVRVDLDPAGGGVDRLATWIAAPPVGEDQLAVRGDATFALRLVPHAPSGRVLTPRPGTSWLVTGGLGALGLAVATHLADLGATHLLLCGRSAPSPAAEAQLAALRARGVTVAPHAVDVADPEAVARAVAAADALAPLAGIVHAAGVLADGPVLQQDAERFAAVYGAKVAGALNLHRATRDHALDAFVLFSSVTASLGAPGQVNYAAANQVLDALAAHRRAQGRPGVAIDWGPWGEIGMAAHLAPLMAARGMGGLPTADALDAFAHLAADAEPRVLVMDLRARDLLARDPAFGDAPLMRELVATLRSAGATTPSAPVSAAAPAPTAPAPAPAAAATPRDRDGLASVIAALAADLLGVTADEVQVQRPLAWQGFDSVLAVDLQRALAARYGAELPHDLVTTGPSPRDLADALLERLPDTPPPATHAPAPAATAATPPADPHAALLGALVGWTADLMGFAPDELDPQRPLAWQGFDSVMAVDLHKALLERLGVDVPLDQLLAGPRLAQVADDVLPQVPADRLADLGGAPAPAAPTPPPAVPPSARPAPTPTSPPTVPAATDDAGPTTRAPVPALVWVTIGLLVGALLSWGSGAFDDDSGAGTPDDAPAAQERRRRRER